MNLKFCFTATKCRSWPKLKLYVDNTLYKELSFNSATGAIDVKVDALFHGNHVIDIELHGKTIYNTIVKDNVIVEDQTVTLDSVYLDDVKLPDFVKYKGIFDSTDQTLSPCLTWGLNGKWSLNFTSPVINWLLETKTSEYNWNEKDNRGELSNYTNPIKTNAMITGLQQLEQILKNVNI